MVETRQHFQNRLNLIGHKNQAMGRDFTTKMFGNGMITVKRSSRRSDISLRGIIILLLVSFYFKAFVLASVGTEEYSDRVATLMSGTLLESGGAWIMQADPLSLKVAEYIKLLHKY